MKYKILIVDDQADVRVSAAFLLENHGFQVADADSPQAAFKLLENHSFDVILMDMNYSSDTTSGAEGLQLLQELQVKYPQLTPIVMTAWSNVEIAVEAMRIGAKDFVEKPWDNQRLVHTINQSLKVRQLEQQNSALKQQNAELSPTDDLVFESSAMQSLLKQLNRLAKTDATILLTGENGTGKSSIARHIHTLSQRSEHILVSVNMGAIPENLFESEMFGHKKGAFTDAKEERIGRFQLAESGTLFLDEIANIPVSQQAKLLRVLEDNEFEMVGSSQTKSTDVRLICATNAKIQQQIDEGKFRADLYFRLNTLEVHIPPLRERTQDIIPLAAHFITKHAQRYNLAPLVLSKTAQTKLLNHTWPGNVRELSHMIERAILLTEGNVIEADDILFKSQTGTVNQSQSKNTTQTTNVATEIASNQVQNLPLMPLDEAELQLIIKALERTQGNTLEAANILGLSQSAMYRRLEKYGLNKAKN